MVLERLVTAKHLLDAAAIDRRKVAWAEDYLRGRASAAGTMSGPWSGHSATGEMRRSRVSMFDPAELIRVQTLCRKIYRTNGEGRAAASSIGYNRNQFSEAQLAGSTACRRLACAIYVVQTA
jgi:hypothetical protein